MEAELMTSNRNYGAFAFGNEEKRRCASSLRASCNLGARERKIVCVTSGNSRLSCLIVRQLLAHAYSVRVTLQHHVDFEEMKSVLGEEEMNKLEGVVVAKMEDVEALCEAFRGCHAIFHTCSFIDPRGASGYSERMAFLETEAARNVVEACGRTAYVKRCIFTSSLLASVWQGADSTTPGIVDETCWSDEDFCRENKIMDVRRFFSEIILNRRRRIHHLCVDTNRDATLAR
uniref:3-beta hydroxysteroid dehydrogenase/isomerase domain-containing protein n=1 Tax=Kalanchoe fedtschenkoi TaxID=63787 RepID=A0A7N0TN88_KALFE